MAYNLIGKDFTPMDVEAKVTGRAKYAEDFRAENMVFCKTLTSPIPHARIKSIDTSAATKMQGVLGILTADDVPQFPPPALPILAKDSRMRPQLLPAMYPRLDEWRAERELLDPHHLFVSDLSRRLSLC